MLYQGQPVLLDDVYGPEHPGAQLLVSEVGLQATISTLQGERARVTYSGCRLASRITSPAAAPVPACTPQEDTPCRVVFAICALFACRCIITSSRHWQWPVQAALTLMWSTRPWSIWWQVCL